MRNSNYLLAFDEINRLYGSFNDSLTSLFNNAYKTLKSGYMLGWLYVEGLLDDKRVSNDKVDNKRTADEKTIESVIFAEIEGEDVFDRLESAYNDNDTERIKKIMCTEYHRVYNTAEMNRAEDSPLTNKIWSTVGDNRVRETHEYLEGIAVPMNTEFITSDGDSAQYPGGFSNASNNVNCRCWLEFT